MNQSIPSLKIELMDESDRLILLEQEHGGNTDRVVIHPLHLRYMTEKFGLVAIGDPLAQKAVNTLTRRLILLEDRISHLADYLANHSDHQHADLSYELAYARATADIAVEFCAELDDQFGPDPAENNASTMAALGGYGANTAQASLI